MAHRGSAGRNNKSARLLLVLGALGKHLLNFISTNSQPVLFQTRLCQRLSPIRPHYSTLTHSKKPVRPYQSNCARPEPSLPRPPPGSCCTKCAAHLTDRLTEWKRRRAAFAMLLVSRRNITDDCANVRSLFLSPEKAKRGATNREAERSGAARS